MNWMLLACTACFCAECGGPCTAGDPAPVNGGAALIVVGIVFWMIVFGIVDAVRYTREARRAAARMARGSE